MMSDPAAAPADASEPTPWASSHGRRTAPGIFWVFLGDALILPTGLVTAGFLTRRLGPEDYGLFTLATVLVSVANRSSCRSSRPRRSASSEPRKTGGRSAPRWRAYLVAGLRLALAFVAAALPVGIVFREQRLAGYLALAAVEIPLLSFCQAHINVLVGLGGFRDSRAGAGRPLGRAALLLTRIGRGQPKARGSATSSSERRN
jgi:O-antigen/teichoic acid export membrane protein